MRDQIHRGYIRRELVKGETNLEKITPFRNRWEHNVPRQVAGIAISRNERKPLCKQRKKWFEPGPGWPHPIPKQ